MKKKILVTGLLVSVLAIASYADADGDGDQNMMMNQRSMGSNSAMSQQRGMMNQSAKFQRSMMMKRRGMMGGMMNQRHSKMMNMFRQLNLNEKQRFNISIIRDEMKLDMKKLMGPDRKKKMLSFITDSGFDKEAFKKQMNDMHKKMLNIKADSMEKIFNILTREQIAQLKKNLSN